jgi:uncharacterized DUF497 family protein
VAAEHRCRQGVQPVRVCDHNVFVDRFRELQSLESTTRAIERRIALYTEIPYSLEMSDRFDPAKDATNREKHKLSLAFGDRIFEDDNHLIIPSVREVDGEERFKVIGSVEGKLFTGVFVWRGDLARFISVRRSNTGEERAYHSAF